MTRVKDRIYNRFEQNLMILSNLIHSGRWKMIAPNFIHTRHQPLTLFPIMVMQKWLLVQQ